MADEDPYRRQQQPIMPQMPGIAIMQPPESSTTVGSSTRTTEMSPDYAAAVTAQGEAFDAQAQAARDAGEAAVNQANADVQQAEAERAEHERFAAEQAAALERQAAIKAEKVAARDARTKELETAAQGRATTYWDDKGALAEIASHFVVGLSEKSHRLAGGEGGQSPMQKELDRKLADDERSKMARFENSKMFLDLAKSDVTAAEEAKRQELDEIRNKHLVMLDGVAKKFGVIAKGFGTATAQAKAAAAVAEVKNKKAEVKASQEKGYGEIDKTRTGSTTTTVPQKQKGDEEKPDQIIPLKGGEGGIKAPSTSIGASVRKVLAASGAVGDALLEEAETSAELFAAKDPKAKRSAETAHNEALRKLAKAALENKSVESVDPSTGITTNIKIPYLGSIGGKLVDESTKVEDLEEHFRSPRGKIAVMNLRSDIRDSVSRTLTDEFAIPTGDAGKLVGSYLPDQRPKVATPARSDISRSSALDELTSVMADPRPSIDKINLAITKARAARVPDDLIKRLARRNPVAAAIADEAVK